MKLRALAVFPVLWVALFLIAVGSAPDPDAVTTVIRTEIEAAKLFGLAGCLTAAFTFNRGDYLRRAWLFHGSCFALLLLRDLLYLRFVHGTEVFGLPYAYVQAGLVLVANLGAVVGTFMIARAWQVAGIELPGSRAQRAAVIGGAVVLSLAITGHATLLDLRRLFAGEVAALVGLASDVGDVLSMCFIAPVLLTALALRGGVLIWPWGLLTASLVSWLLYDATSSFGPLSPFSKETVRVISEVFRGFACTFGFAAGVAQRLVLPRRERHSQGAAKREASASGDS